MTIRCLLRTLAAFFLPLGLFACSPAGRSGAALVPEESSFFVDHPQRVVSLYPTASEILAAIGAADRIAGITIHDARVPGLTGKPLVGGFESPDVERVIALRPDCVIATPLQAEAVRTLRDRGIPLLLLDTRSIEEGEANIRRLGSLVGREKEAEGLIARERDKIELTSAKLAKLAASGPHTPRRTMRLMGFAGDRLLVPGDDSFQNELIRNAGGQPPSFGRNGQVIAISPEEWRAFNPEFVYWCQHDPAMVRRRLGEPAWAGVPAVQNDQLTSYPCEAINQVSAYHGYFSLWLSTDLYGKGFSELKNQARDDAILERRRLELPFGYVRSAEVLEARLFDMPATTLLLRFTKSQTVLSTLTGWADGISAVGNHSSNSLSWAVTHHLGFEKSNARILDLFQLREKTSVFLHTGADVNDMAYAERSSDGFTVGVLATAGVLGNAMRVSVDSGDFVEPGTINLIILTNRKLSSEAMSRALIRACEGKTAALEDLDIRSTYSGTPATGTGTDNVVVVSGEGVPASMAGGHSKLGELISRATYAAVREAVERHNRLYANRDIFQRLNEYQINLVALINGSAALPDAAARRNVTTGLERTLIDPRYAGFLEGALALSDSHERGLIHDTGLFSQQCLLVAEELSGKKISALEPVFSDGKVPLVIRQALNALATGIVRR